VFVGMLQLLIAGTHVSCGIALPGSLRASD